MNKNKQDMRYGGNSRTEGAESQSSRPEQEQLKKVMERRQSEEKKIKLKLTGDQTQKGKERYVRRYKQKSPFPLGI